MVSGAAQGRLLMHLASMTRTGRILELGTFTGYATACLLAGASNVAQVLEQEGISFDDSDGLHRGPYVASMERDSRAFNLAAAHLRVVSEHGFNGEEAAEATGKLRSEGAVEEVKEDIVSVTIDDTTKCDLLRVTDALATMEAMASGEETSIGFDLGAPFDMVFVDADKTRLLEYVEACLNSSRLLKPGGLIVVDNVLWKGLVLEASSGTFTSLADTDEAGEADARKNRRARKLATTMHQFNAAIANDDRLDVLVLPIRDGLSILRKK
ncbi:MAG: hypothetical protein SGARI_005742 [Bacillariaceae sp.]